MQQIFQLFTFQLVSSIWNDSFKKRKRKGDEMGHRDNDKPSMLNDEYRSEILRGVRLSL